MKNTILVLIYLLLPFVVKGDENKNADLMQAVRDNDKEKVAQLLAHGADPNASDYPGGISAFEIAVLEDYGEIRELLAQKGASTHGITKLMIACREKNLQYLVKFATSYRVAAVQDDKGNTAFTYAVLADSMDCVSIFLKYKSLINKKNNEGQTSLFVVQSKKMLDFLVKNGGDINQTNNYDQNPLFVYGMNGNVELVKAAIELGANLKLVDKGGRNILGWLTAETERGNRTSRYLEIIKILKSHGIKSIGENVEG